MINCILCGKLFKNNMGGSLTSHIVSFHNITMEEYVVITKFNNIEPLCECGFCLETPLFYRGKFSRYAKNHNTYNHIIKCKLNYKIPKCINCGNDATYNSRGTANKYCSKCYDFTKTPFENKIIQTTIVSKNIERYGVDNISKCDFIKSKISLSNKGKSHSISDDMKRHLSTIMKEKWNDPKFKIKQSKLIKDSTNTVEEKLRRKKQIENRIEQGLPVFINLNTMSKLHNKIRDKLSLGELGFISEYSIGPYIVDEINLDHNLIIEINGNHIHANPNKYKSTDIIKIGSTNYIAEDKWKYDKQRLNFLIENGYYVITIWENSDLIPIKDKILDLIYYN